MSSSDSLPSYHYILENLAAKNIPESPDFVILSDYLINNDFNSFTKYLKDHPTVVGTIPSLRSKYGHNLLFTAIKINNVRITTMLVQLDNDLFSLANALLIAVENNDFEVMILLLRKLRKLKQEKDINPTIVIPCKGPRGFWRESCDQFAPYVTPMLLACESNNFISIKILLKYGERLYFPHPKGCKCTVCLKNRHYTLTEAMARFRQHKALICPAYMCLTNVDPILKTFRLKQDFLEESIMEPEFTEEYVALSEQCVSFATEMLSLCRTREEVMVLLSRKSEFKHRPTRPFNRVAQALELKCLDFVAHLNCQQVLSTEWYKNNEWMKHAGKLNIFLYFVIRTIFLPFLVAILLIAPFSPLAEKHRSPSNRYMNDASSYTLFLIITLSVTYFTDDQESTRGPPETALLYALIIYVIGIWYDKMTLVYKRGRQAFLLNPWNLYDVLMLTFYTLTFVTWAISAREVRLDPDSNEIPREYWPAYEPKLVGETFYSIAILLSFGRLFSFMQISKAIGPLQLCIYRMVLYVIPFLLILIIVWAGFSVTLYILYHYYSDLSDKIPAAETKQSNAFMTLSNSLHSVYWLFLGIYELHHADVIVPPLKLKVGDQVTILRHQQFVTQNTGYLLFGFFHLLGAVILMNMLIAIMSDAYAAISSRGVVEFKVARTKVWMGYFYPDHHLPPPFNLIPKPFTVYRHLHELLTHKPAKLIKEETDFANADAELYQRLMVNLIRRYFKNNYKGQLENKADVDAWADV